MTRSCSSDIFASDKWYPFLELTTPEKYFEAIAGKYPYRIVPLSHTPLCIHTHTLLSLLTILTFARLLVLRIRIFRHWPFNNNNNSFIITLNKGEFLQSFSQKKKRRNFYIKWCSMIKEWPGTKLTNFLEEWDYVPTIFNFGYPCFLSLPVLPRLQTHQSQRGSWINTDRFPKRAPKGHASRRFRENALLGNAFDFNSLKSPFMVFWVVQTGYWPVSFSFDEALQLGKIFLY